MANISTSTFNTLTDLIGSAYLASLGDYIKWGTGNAVLPLTSVALSGTVTSNVNSVNTNLLTATGSSTTFTGTTIPLTIGQTIYASGSPNTYYRLVMIISGTQAVIDVVPGTALTTASMYQARDWGLSYQARTSEVTVLDLTDYAQVNTLLGPVHSIQTYSGILNNIKSALNGYLTGLNSVCAAPGYAGVSTADTFAYYFNQGAGAVAATSYNQAMFSPDFAIAYFQVNGARPSAWNIYPPATSNTSYNMGWYASSTFNAGFPVDGLAYGGFPSLNVVTTGYTGSINISVSCYVRSVSNYNTVGAISTYSTTAQARTYTISGSVGTIAYPPSGSNAGDQILQVTGITINSSTGSGTVTVYGALPSGRVFPASLQSP